MKRIMIAVIFLLTVNTYAIAAEGSQQYCENTYSISYSRITNTIYLCCTDTSGNCSLLAVDPATSELSTIFPVAGHIKDVFPIEDPINGDYLLLLLSETDGNPATQEGLLQKVNPLDGSLMPGNSQLSFSKPPLAMVVDNVPKYAYVSSGLSPLEPATINKISLANLQIIPDEEAAFGFIADHMAITSNGTKLYVKSMDLCKTDDEPYPIAYWEIGVFDTSGMTPWPDTPIKIMNVMPASLIMGYDERLYLSNAIPYTEEDSNFALVVVDTNLDVVTHRFSFDNIAPNTGAFDIELDGDNHKLYCTASLKNFYNEKIGTTEHDASNVIVEVDLETYNYSSFTLGDERLWNIVAATIDSNTNSWIYAIAYESPVIHFIEVDW